MGKEKGKVREARCWMVEVLTDLLVRVGPCAELGEHVDREDPGRVAAVEHLKVNWLLGLWGTWSVAVDESCEVEPVVVGELQVGVPGVAEGSLEALQGSTRPLSVQAEGGVVAAEY